MKRGDLLLGRDDVGPQPTAEQLLEPDEVHDRLALVLALRGLAERVEEGVARLVAREQHAQLVGVEGQAEVGHGLLGDLELWQGVGRAAGPDLRELEGERDADNGGEDVARTEQIGLVLALGPVGLADLDRVELAAAAGVRWYSIASLRISPAEVSKFG